VGKLYRVVCRRVANVRGVSKIGRMDGWVDEWKAGSELVASRFKGMASALHCV